MWRWASTMRLRTARSPVRWYSSNHLAVLARRASVSAIARVVTQGRGQLRCVDRCRRLLDVELARALGAFDREAIRGQLEELEGQRVEAAHRGVAGAGARDGQALARTREVERQGGVAGVGDD